MKRKRHQPTEFEKAVSLGVQRVSYDPEIKALEENARKSDQDNLWTEPREEWKIYRTKLAEYIAADLRGEKDEPAQYHERLFNPSAQKWLNEDGHFYDTFRDEWKHYQQRIATATIEQIIAVFPLKGLREKRERGHRTDIESLVEQALRKRGEPYEFEFMIGFNLVDFALPARRIVIECDGEYWHDPDNLFKDVNKTLMLEEHGWEVYRLRFTKKNTSQDSADIWVNEILDGNEGRDRHRLASVTQPPEIQEMYSFSRALKLVSDGQAKLLEQWSDVERDYRRIQLLNGQTLEVSRLVPPEQSQWRKALVARGGRVNFRK